LWVKIHQISPCLVSKCSSGSLLFKCAIIYGICCSAVKISSGFQRNNFTSGTIAREIEISLLNEQQVIVQNVRIFEEVRSPQVQKWCICRQWQLLEVYCFCIVTHTPLKLSPRVMTGIVGDEFIKSNFSIFVQFSSLDK